MILTKIIPLGFLVTGVFLLTQVILPFVSFEIWQFGQKYENAILISPNSRQDSQVLGVSVQNKDNFPIFYSTLKRETESPYQEFILTVPKLKIKDALVKVDSNDLSKSLTHLPGSALPGEKGNVFISGHSALNRSLSLKVALFASLSDLKKGDEIIVDAASAKFKYQVVNFRVVDQTDLSVINPPDDQGRYISLMTCVPPGLNFKRLIVLGKMM